MSTTGSADIVLDVEPLTTAAPKESSWPKVTGSKDVQAVPSWEFSFSGIKDNLVFTVYIEFSNSFVIVGGCWRDSLSHIS